MEKYLGLPREFGRGVVKSAQDFKKNVGSVGQTLLDAGKDSYNKFSEGTMVSDSLRGTTNLIRGTTELAGKAAEYGTKGVIYGTKAAAVDLPVGVLRATGSVLSTGKGPRQYSAGGRVIIRDKEIRRGERSDESRNTKIRRKKYTSVQRFKG
jgi:hypothetical protein